MYSTKNENFVEQEIPVASTKPVKWLQKLKEESWEAELLISAIAIFGTFQLFKVINWLTNIFIDQLPVSQYLIGYFIVVMGLLAVSVLVSMFVIHFFLRAYWVGLVGLNSVYPDYSIEDSAYSEIYTEKILSILPKLKDSLIKVDQLCSVIFSAAFCILLIYSYLALTATIYLFIFNFLSQYVPNYILIIPVAAIIFITLLQSIIGIVANLKMFKHNQSLQLFAFKLVKIASVIMFGPLYKSLLQITMTFGSNFKKNKALVRLVVLFLLSGIVVAVAQIGNTYIFYLIGQDYYFDSTKLYSGFYQSENKNTDFLLTPEIQSDLIQSSTIKLFIPIFSHEDKIQEETCGSFKRDENEPRSQNRRKAREFNLACYSTYNQVFLNGKKQNSDFIKYYHSKTGQFGILSYISGKVLLKGKNTIDVKKVNGKEVVSEWSIPFQKL